MINVLHSIDMAASWMQSGSCENTCSLWDVTSMIDGVRLRLVTKVSYVASMAVARRSTLFEDLRHTAICLWKNTVEIYTVEMERTVNVCEVRSRIHQLVLF
jgi:hypothetical protein